jgi:hypothetical protein
MFDALDGDGDGLIRKAEVVAAIESKNETVVCIVNLLGLPDHIRVGG